MSVLLDMRMCGIGDHMSAMPSISTLDAVIYSNRFTSGMYERNYILAAGQIESAAFRSRYDAVIDFSSTSSRYYEEQGKTSLMEMFAERANVTLPKSFSWIDYWKLGKRTCGDYMVLCDSGSDTFRSLPNIGFNASRCIRLASVSAGGEQKSDGFFASNFKQLALFIYDAKAVISVDSGPLHLACALETPVVSLYGPTGEAIGSQYERYVKVNQTVVRGEKNKCAMPCYRNEKNGFSRCSSLRHGHCMSTITPKQIEEAYAGIE